MWAVLKKSMTQRVKQYSRVKKESMNDTVLWIETWFQYLAFRKSDTRCKSSVVYGSRVSWYTCIQIIQSFHTSEKEMDSKRSIVFEKGRYHGQIYFYIWMSRTRRYVCTLIVRRFVHSTSREKKASRRIETRGYRRKFQYALKLPWPCIECIRALIVPWKHIFFVLPILVQTPTSYNCVWFCLYMSLPFLTTCSISTSKNAYDGRNELFQS